MPKGLVYVRGIDRGAGEFTGKVASVGTTTEDNFTGESIDVTTKMEVDVITVTETEGDAAVGVVPEQNRSPCTHKV